MSKFEWSAGGTNGSRMCLLCDLARGECAVHFAGVRKTGTMFFICFDCARDIGEVVGMTFDDNRGQPTAPA